MFATQVISNYLEWPHYRNYRDWWQYHSHYWHTYRNWRWCSFSQPLTPYSFKPCFCQFISQYPCYWSFLLGVPSSSKSTPALPAIGRQIELLSYMEDKSLNASLSNFESVSNNVCVSRITNMSLSEYHWVLKEYCSRYHKRNCSTCPSLLTLKS